MLPNVVLIGKTYYIKELFDNFIGLNKYIKYYINDNDNDNISYLNNRNFDFFNTCECNNIKIVVDNMNHEFESIKKLLINNYNIDTDRIIEMKDWLADVLENDVEVKLCPNKIRLDVCTTCQLKCADCYMRKDNYGSVGNGYLKFERFKQFIDTLNYVKEIEISNNGEVFLNPDIDKILEYAYKKNIAITINNGTNFNYIKESTLESLVKYHVKSITFSIDGATNETYKKYRINGNLDKVIENIKKLNFYKHMYNSDFPFLNWQYIIMKQNVNEIKEAKELAEKLGLNILYKREWSYSFIPNNVDEVEKITGIKYTTDDKIYNSLCTQMIYSPQINWDGRILGCCTVYRSDWEANAFDDGLINALNSSKYRDGLITLLRCNNINNKSKKNIPCNDCYTFTKNNLHFNI